MTHNLLWLHLLLISSSLNVIYSEMISTTYSLIVNTTESSPEKKFGAAGRAKAETGQFPEAVAILLVGQFMCSGSIISPDTVLTAAICVAMVPDLQVSDVSVVTSSTDRRSGLVVNASVVTTHPQFRYYPQQLVLEHDLALIRLATPLILDGENVSAIQLPESSSSPDTWANESAIIVGWGVDGAGRRDTTLQFMNVTITQQEDCAKYYGALTPAPYILDAGQMCSTPSKELCIGESGAGLRVAGQDGAQLLVGIAGPAVGCPAPQRPEIYTRIAHYLPWIRDHMTSPQNESSSA